MEKNTEEYFNWLKQKNKLDWHEHLLDISNEVEYFIYAVNEIEKLKNEYKLERLLSECIRNNKIKI